MAAFYFVNKVRMDGDGGTRVLLPSIIIMYDEKVGFNAKHHIDGIDAYLLLGKNNAGRRSFGRGLNEGSEARPDTDRHLTVWYDTIAELRVN